MHSNELGRRRERETLWQEAIKCVSQASLSMMLITLGMNLPFIFPKWTKANADAYLDTFTDEEREEMVEY